MAVDQTVQRRGRAARVAELAARKTQDQRPVRPGMVGCRYNPLTQSDIERIHHTVLDLMEQVGFADPIPSRVAPLMGATFPARRMNFSFLTVTCRRSHHRLS